jgi:hypothetical protein
MLPLIQKEVLAHDWMEIEEVINFIAVSESTPGPFAINCATYVGMETGGIFGAICATLGVVTPSFIVILCVARFYKKLSDNKVKVLLSNSDPHNVNYEDNFFDDLYAEYNIQRITAVRMINSKAEKRGNVTELLIKNY